jgi:alginate O-acetyltransferase complex protein AlgJ
MRLNRASQTIKGIGDIVAMLRLPPTSHLYPKEAVAIHPILRADGLPWSPDPRADVLVLGDSFFNIFSLEGMGWGASAGFVETQHALHVRLMRLFANAGHGNS